jgi:RimJ/RimL family protein N-acetyltransferase
VAGVASAALAAAALAARFLGVRLEAGDLVLRSLVDADVPAIVAACQDPEIPRWTSVPTPYTEEDARTFLAGSPNMHSLAIVDAGDEVLLGCMGYQLLNHSRATFGYWVAREARGRGVASRALRVLARWALREHGLARVQLIVEPDNVASIRVAENAGFRREALLRSYIELHGRRRDVYLYALLAEDVEAEV